MKKMAADPLEALFAQFLSGGTPHVINPVQVQGPNIPGMSGGGGGGEGDGGMGGFEALAGGVLDYIDRKDAKTKAERGTNNTSAWKNPEMFPNNQRPPERPQGPMPQGDVGRPHDTMNGPNLPQPPTITPNPGAVVQPQAGTGAGGGLNPQIQPEEQQITGLMQDPRMRALFTLLGGGTRQA